MGNTDKYKVYQLYKSSDGINWSPRDEYKAVLLEEKSTDCGYSARTITTSEDDCSGTTKITTTTILNQESEDFGETWTTVSSSSTETYEELSADCGYIPTGYTAEYCSFVAKSSGTFKFSGTTDYFREDASQDSPIIKTIDNKLSYSRDGGNTWSEPSQNITVNVNSGDTVLWKGEVIGYEKEGDYLADGIGTFSGSTASFDAQGNIFSLVYGDYFVWKKYFNRDSTFQQLLWNTKIINAENLILPRTVNAYCYIRMFGGCESLITTPKLPATQISSYGQRHCYTGMFENCTSLTVAPELPATTLSIQCYSHMFQGCTSLTKAPELPATTLASGCYFGMFSGCTSLTTAPQLPATTLKGDCYGSMFYGCTSLTVAPVISATTVEGVCCAYMFYGCTSLTTAPQLLATTLEYYCYGHMFDGCTSLNYIKMLATDVSAYNCLFIWVRGVSSYGTFVKNTSARLPSGENGIPTGWTVLDASS